MWTPASLSWSLLELLLRWSAAVGVVVAVAGLALTRDVRFVATFGVASVTDIGSLAAITSWGRRLTIEDHPSMGGRFGAAILARFAMKAVLLVLAAQLAWLHFVGAVLGVLLVDTTLLVGGWALVIRATRAGTHGPGDANR